MGLGGKEVKRAKEGKKYVMPRGQEYNSDFSIGDYLVPEPEPFVDFLLMIIRKLTEGKRVNIFCTAGEGRSGMTVTCFLHMLCVDDALTKARVINKHYVETHHQKAFCETFRKAVEDSGYKEEVTEESIKKLKELLKERVGTFIYTSTPSDKKEPP